MSDDIQGIRDRLAKQGEETLGKLAQDLLENPLVNSAITRAFGAREKAVQVQETAMGALNLPSAADVERLTRRIRSVAQRLEGIEDALDRLDRRLESTATGGSPASGGDDRIEALERQVATLVTEVRVLTRSLDAAPQPVHRAQERLKVENATEKPKPPARKSAAAKPAAAKPAAAKPAAAKPARRKPAAKAS
jgi:hypothetical protein